MIFCGMIVLWCWIIVFVVFVVSLIEWEIGILLSLLFKYILLNVLLVDVVLIMLVIGIIVCFKCLLFNMVSIDKGLFLIMILLMLNDL